MVLNGLPVGNDRRIPEVWLGWKVTSKVCHSESNSKQALFLLRVGTGDTWQQPPGLEGLLALNSHLTSL
jgi:hypothetical protein